MSLASRLRLRREHLSPRLLGGNSFEVVAGGPAWYAALKSGIRNARKEVLLQSYLWEDDDTSRSFLGECMKAARRGVRVRVIIDGFGGLGMGSPAMRRFLEAGGECGYYNPIGITLKLGRLFRRNHRKMAVFDGAVAFIGGFGFSKRWARNPPGGWWDVGARVRGPVVGQFRDLFYRDWAHCGRRSLPDFFGAASAGRVGERLRLLPSVFGRLVFLRRLRHAILSARKRAYICTTYFIPNPLMRWALRRAARKGIDVRLLLPTPRRESLVFRFAGRRHYGSLLAAGVRIFEYQAAFCHAKYALTDSHWGLIGSSNLDSLSGWKNLEADLEARTEGAVCMLASRFLGDIRGAREITLARWVRRPLWTRVLERLFGYFDPVL